MAKKLSTYSVFKKMVIHNKDIHMLSQEEVEQVQRVLLSIMDDIHAVCQKYQLRYVLSGGCAIGVIRHGGFIPWDDDIDICMPRKDYDRFCQIFVNEYPDKYYLQEIRACEGYDLNFAKVRLKNSVFCEFLDPEQDKAGVFIDILPIENVYNNSIRRKWQRLWSDGMQFICSCVRIRKKQEMLIELAGGSEEAIQSIRTKARIGGLFSFRSFRSWLLATERVLMKNKDETTEYISIPTGGKHFAGETYPRNWIFPAKQMKFEDRQYYFMAEVESYLGKMYGNYMQIPPEDQRERHVLKAFHLPEEILK